MIRIGFIDYYLDEWHANNYPALIQEITGGEMKVCCAWAYSEPPAEKNRRSNAQWAADMDIALLPTVESVIENSDCLVVLSPDDPQMHEFLCDAPLRSGKHTYIDKTFAPDKETAQRIFDHADRYGTKCFSSSALRFCTEWEKIDRASIYKLYSEGPGKLEIYSIHQLEPIVALMGSRAKRLMALDNACHPSLLIEFEDGRLAQMHHRSDPGGTFRMTVVNEANKAVHYQIHSDYFRLFVEAMVTFFRTGQVPVSHEQTIDVIALRTAAVEACKMPFQWIAL